MSLSLSCRSGNTQHPASSLLGLCGLGLGSLQGPQLWALSSLENLSSGTALFSVRPDGQSGGNLGELAL